MSKNLISEYREALYQYKVVYDRVGKNSIAYTIINEKLDTVESKLQERGMLYETQITYGSREDLR